MRVPDTTVVVAAIFQVAEKEGNGRVTPGAVAKFLTREFGLNLPLHTVSEILRIIGLETKTVGNNRYIVWDPATMAEIRRTYLIARRN